jgi:hypothetical protein
MFSSLLGLPNTGVLKHFQTYPYATFFQHSSAPNSRTLRSFSPIRLPAKKRGYYGRTNARPDTKGSRGASEIGSFIRYRFCAIGAI